MIVANIKSPQDLQSKKTLQTQLLELEVANEAESEKRMRDYKNPNRPIPIAPEYKSNAQLQQDRIAQERQAISNMEELGFDYTKSAELIAWLSSSLINRLVEFNANFKGIKKELTETTNPKLLNAEYLKNYLEKYFEDIDINFGRKFGKEAVSSSATPSSATLDELDEILPEIRTIDEIREHAREFLRYLGEAKIRGTTEGTFLNSETKLDEEINRLKAENEKRKIEDISVLTEQGRRDYKEERKMYERKISELKREQAIISELMPKMLTIVALLKLYSAVVPSHQMLNLLKQSLTQKERGDLVRRYIIILRQSNFLSRSGADELASEISELLYRVQNEGVIPFLSELIRWVNKSLKALSFVSNEAGISKITKLQRDYEILLNQSGKIGEYERLKQYTDIMEKEIADGQAEMRKAMEEPAIEIEDFLINPETQYIRRETPLTEKMSDRDSERYFQDVERYGDFVKEYAEKLRELEDDERVYKEILKKSRNGLSAEDKDKIMGDLLLTQQAIKNLKGAKEDYITTEKNQNRDRIEYLKDRQKAEREYLKLVEAKAGRKEALEAISRLQPPDEYKPITEKKEKSPIENIKSRQDFIASTMAKNTNNFISELSDIYKGDVRELRKAELEVLAAKTEIAKKLLSKRYFEIEQDYQLSAIATARKYLIDNAGLTQKNTSRQGRDNEEWFSDLIYDIETYFKSRRDDAITDAEYDPIAKMVRANVYNSKGAPIGETRYGVGLSRDLAKHFRKDEKEIKQMAKELKRHKEREKSAEKASSSSESDDEVKRGGAGVGFRHKKISVRSASKKVGRGITATETPSYLSFGKYVIHMGHLLDRNIANFKYPSLGSIPSIKPLTISEDYKEFILDTLDNQKPNERLFNKLSADEQKHFERVVSGAGLVDTFKLKRNRTEQEKKDCERFELLRGEVMAGNNSEKVLKELRGLIVRFINEGRIHQREGTNMLMEISAL